MAEIVTGVVTHLIAAGTGGAIVHVFKHYESLFRSWRNKDIEEIAKHIDGRWNATEVFSDDGSKAIFSMEFKCIGTQVTGVFLGVSGKVDKGSEFDLSGSFKDRVLSFTWKKRNSLESGTVTVLLTRDNELEGHGLYVNPKDGKVYHSKFSAKK